MMKQIEKDWVIRACNHLVNRENNAGCWVGGQIPQIFYGIKEKYYPNLPGEAHEWLLTIESVVKQNAVRMVSNMDKEDEKD